MDLSLALEISENKEPTQLVVMGKNFQVVG